jgi:16S rRNA C1402 (ribose-2'-O) methylase RsmI
MRGHTLKAAATLTHPVIILDAPYRLLAVLEACGKAFGVGRRGMLARDISGPLESYWVAPLEQLLKDSQRFWDDEHEKINFVLIIDGR